MIKELSAHTFFSKKYFDLISEYVFEWKKMCLYVFARKLYQRPAMGLNRHTSSDESGGNLGAVRQVDFLVGISVHHTQKFRFLSRLEDDLESFARGSGAFHVRDEEGGGLHSLPQTWCMGRFHDRVNAAPPFRGI